MCESKLHRVEDVELGLRAEVGGVGDAGTDQVVLGLAGDIARIARVRLKSEWVVHVEVHVQCPGPAERVDGCGLRIRKQQHVGLVDRLESANRGAVEGQTFLEHILIEGVDRNCEVLHGAWQVTEADVDIFDVLVLGEFEDVVGRLFGHGMLLIRLSAVGRPPFMHAVPTSASGRHFEGSLNSAKPGRYGS